MTPRPRSHSTPCLDSRHFSDNAAIPPFAIRHFLLESALASYSTVPSLVRSSQAYSAVTALPSSRLSTFSFDSLLILGQCQTTPYIRCLILPSTHLLADRNPAPSTQQVTCRRPASSPVQIPAPSAQHPTPMLGASVHDVKLNAASHHLSHGAMADTTLANYLVRDAMPRPRRQGPSRLVLPDIFFRCANV